MNQAVEEEPLFATAAQFRTLVLRMMPSEFSNMGEGKLIAEIFYRAWADGHKQSSRFFFLAPKGGSAFWCDQVGLDASQIRSMFIKHCEDYQPHLAETTSQREDAA